MNRDQDFEKVIDQAILEFGNDGGLGDRTQFIGASEIGCCPRLLYHKKLAEKKGPTRGYHVRGHVTELGIIRVLKEAGVDIRWYGKRQKHFTEGALHAHIDGILYASGHPYSTYEGKSVDPRGLYKGFHVSNRFKAQVQAEIGLAHNHFDTGIKEGKLVIVDASDYGEQQVYRFPYLPEEYKKLVEKASQIIGCVGVGIEPSPIPDKDDCKWCAFKADCPAYEPPEQEEEGYIDLNDEDLDKLNMAYLKAKEEKDSLYEMIKLKLKKIGANKVRLENTKNNWYKTSKKVILYDRLKKEKPDIVERCKTFSEKEFAKMAKGDKDLEVYLEEKPAGSRLLIKPLKNGK